MKKLNFLVVIIQGMDTRAILYIAQFLGTKSLLDFASTNSSIRSAFRSTGPEFWKDRWVFYMEPCDPNICNTFEGFLKLCGMWHTIKQRIAKVKVYRYEKPRACAAVFTGADFPMATLLLPFIKRGFRTSQEKVLDPGLHYLNVEHVAMVHFKPIPQHIGDEYHSLNICGNGEASRQFAKAGIHILSLDDRSYIVNTIICKLTIRHQQTFPVDMDRIMRFTLCAYSLDAVKEYWLKVCSIANALSSIHRLGSQEWRDALDELCLQT